MNDRNFDQLLNAWMDLGPTTAPDRVADAARLEAATTRQLPAFLSRWAPRRFPVMNTTAKVILATAAVVLAVALGYNYLVAPTVGGPRLFAPDPTPTPSPSPSPAAVDFTQHPGEGTALQPGSYRIDYGAPVEVTITVPDEPSGSDPSAWYKAMFDWGPWHQTNTARLGFGDIENLRVDACDPGPGWQDPAVGPGVADLVEGLSANPHHGRDPVRRDARRILRRAPRDHRDGTSGRLFRRADPVGDDARRRGPGPGSGRAHASVGPRCRGQSPRGVGRPGHRRPGDGGRSAGH